MYFRSIASVNNVIRCSLTKKQCSLNVIIVAFHDCQIIIFILKLLHGKKKNCISCSCYCHCHTFSSDFKMLFIFLPPNAQVLPHDFVRIDCFPKLFFVCWSVGWLAGRSSDGTKVYFKYIITIFWYRQLCERWTLNSHQAEIEKLFSMLLFARSKRRRRRRNKKK